MSEDNPNTGSHRYLMDLCPPTKFAREPFYWNAHPAPATIRVQVAMCVMDRIEYLPWTLACLRSQTVSDFRLVIWNNNASQSERVEELTARAKPPFPVCVVHSAENVRGIGRFRLAHCDMLNRECPVFFFDDDQFLHPTCLESLLASWRDGTLIGWWAWKFRRGGGYWDRDRVSPRDVAHHVGTGGLMLAPDILFDRRLVDEIPGEFANIEDLWLSYFATQVLGHRLVAAQNVIMPISDGRDQHLALREQKDAFLKLLRGQFGWTV